jgi:putative ABC transport system substrate-binding protein
MRRRDFIKVIAGSTVAWSSAAQAQQARKLPTVGVLWHAGSADEEGPYFKALIEGFTSLGYLDGRNIKLEHRFPNETRDRFISMAAELVSANVDVLVSVGGVSAVHLKNANSTAIPHVFALLADPVSTGLVQSFARPGGNATGLSNFMSDLVGRRLQLFKEVVPGLSRIGQLVNPDAPIARVNVEAVRSAAAALDLKVEVFETRKLGEFERTFDAMKAAAMQGFTSGPNEGLQFQAREVIAKLALKYGLPYCAFSRETFEPGALMSYAPDSIAIVRRTAVYVDKILKGAKPADLPVEGPTKFEFLINLKTARALGIEVPSIMLSRADDVTE